MATLGPWALTLFFGKKFEPSIPIFITLAITPLVIVVSNVFGILVMHYSRKPLNLTKILIRNESFNYTQ